jgi:hypothetical protein
MLVKEIIAVYSLNHMKPLNTSYVRNVQLMAVKAGGT